MVIYSADPTEECLSIDRATLESFGREPYFFQILNEGFQNEATFLIPKVLQVHSSPPFYDTGCILH